MTDVQNMFEIKMQEFYEQIRKEEPYGDTYWIMVGYQRGFMNHLLDEIREDYPGKAGQIVCEILDYVINHSTSGNAIAHVNTRKFANEVKEIIYETIDDMLLDPVQIYKDNGLWAIDCMFGGFYVPEWDGFYEED